jgi:exoribonuclease R
MHTVKVTKPSYQECYIGLTPVSGLTIFNNKLFHNDLIANTNNLYTLISSNRQSFLIGGILKLTSNTQYKNTKTHKSLYEFVPINWRYPKFLVPSEIKNNLIKKHEKITDYFVVVQFKEWIDKFPSGTIYKCIGPINDLINKYDVLLYYYPERPYVHDKFKLTNSVKLVNYNISDVEFIYSIDPLGCKDIDDALSYNHKNKFIGIHIADVNYTISDLKLQFNKYSTIYAPHKIINMIPDELAYNTCSLIEGFVRPVISCYIDTVTGNYSFKREFIRVVKNYCYDEITNEIIEKNSVINKLFNFSKILNNKNNYVEEIKSSHEMVEVYMIFLNNKVAEILKDKDIIYRNQEPCEFAQYSYENKGHTHMKLQYYTHFTSPIRRFVDQYIHQVFINTILDGKIDIIKPDVNSINVFESELKKVNLLWNYLKVSNNITNGETYILKFIEFNKDYLEFKLLEHNIIISNKILFTIIDDTTICINDMHYKINNTYDLPLYVIDNIKNLYFPKIIIKFNKTNN